MQTSLVYAQNSNVVDGNPPMEIERGRALKDVSEDLGHASMATTDTIYVFKP